MKSINSIKIYMMLAMIFVNHLSMSQNTSINNDLKLLKQGLEVIHPGYTRYTTPEQRQSMWNRLNASVDDDTSLAQVSLEISRLTAQLRCEHTVIELPKSLSEQKRQRFMPFRFKIFNHRMFVDKAKMSTGLTKGDEIISINDKNIAEIIVKLAPLMSRDGYTDHTVIGSIESDYDILGSGFEQYFALELLKLDEYPQSYTIQYRPKNTDAVLSKTLNVINFDEWLALDGQPYRLNFKDAVSLEITGDYAVLTVDTFVNYRKPVNAMKKFKHIFKTLKQKNIKHLIVDLRNNGGGSDDAQLALLKHLYNQPFQVSDAAWFVYSDLGELKNHVQTWDKSVLSPDTARLKKEAFGYRVPNGMLGPNYKRQKPAQMAFEGHIYMLSSKSNVSASAALLSHIKQQSNVTVVGEPTGGNQGGTTATVMLFLKLPHTGISVKIPVFRNRYMIDNALDGQGAQPDVYAYDNYDDWINGQDATLNATIKLINDKNGNTINDE